MNVQLALLFSFGTARTKLTCPNFQDMLGLQSTLRDFLALFILLLSLSETRVRVYWYTQSYKTGYFVHPCYEI